MAFSTRHTGTLTVCAIQTRSQTFESFCTLIFPNGNAKMVSYHGLRGACSCSSCCCCCSACHHTLRASIMSVSIRSVAIMCVSPCKPQCFLLRQASMRRCRRRLRVHSADAAACVSPSERKRERERCETERERENRLRSFKNFKDHPLFYDVRPKKKNLLHKEALQ